MVLITACQPKIGDKCQLHSDCSVTGGRICLPDLSTATQPNFPAGYCTMFNCEPGTCPDEASCVAYGTVPSARPGCADVLSQRFERTFCMRSCSSSSDCRTDSGYACVDLSPKDNPWGAVVVENGARPSTVCVLPASGSIAPVMVAAAGVPGVCAPPADASFPPGPVLAAPDAAPFDAGPSSGGMPDAKVGP